METSPHLVLAIAAALASVPLVQVRAANQSAGQVPYQTSAGTFYSRTLATQSQRQGDMLVAELRQARGEGLHGDPWGMTDSLQEANRLVATIAEAERLKLPYRTPGFGSLPPGPPSPGLRSALDQRLEVDVTLPQQRLHPLGTLEHPMGLIPLHRVYRDVHLALHALRTHPPAIGMALLATADALNGIDWKPGLEPKDWAVAREQVLTAYALTLDGRHGVRQALSLAQTRLSGLPGGKPYALRLAALQAAPSPQPHALGNLVEALDARVQAMRDAAEQAANGGDKGTN
jgi:hypothetical protein